MYFVKYLKLGDTLLTHLIAYSTKLYYMHSERQPWRWYELFKARCFSLIPRQHIVLLLHEELTQQRGLQKRLILNENLI